MSVRTPAKLVSGMPVAGSFAENWENVQVFQAREDDLLIDTYPKSGTTWLSEIVDLILCDGDTEKTQRRAIYKRVPFLEFTVPGLPSGTELLNALESRRLIKSHLPVDLLPKSFWEKNCKIIYVARNPKDVLVSYYHFHRMAALHPEPGTFEEFLHDFIKGTVCYGSWSDHVKSWWKIRHQRNVLYLFYEDLLEDPKREIRKVMRFIEKDLSEDVLEKIHQQTTFASMKENKMANFSDIPTAIMDHTISPFMRKGTCGDWKNQLTVSQNETLDEYYKKAMSDTDLTFHF
ncbi:sulfotransferase 1 family member D1-like [Pseudophryne corroboree]|uniref:sulfotransferase 1 family member D1-like n=1 Tax=Pseudophryne corroboree TaxID=495146 RepID=UPI003081E007